MKNSFISINQLQKADFIPFFDKVKKIEQNRTAFQSACQGKVMSLLFTEPSTRTYASFSSAMQQMGGGVVGVNDPASTSFAKGETLEDSAIVMSHYGDLLVIRQSQPGLMDNITDLVDIPVINAGDGQGEHPTQTLLDLYTIHKQFGHFDLNIGFYGDLKNGRTVHSLMLGLSKLGANFTCIAPDELQMPEKYIQTAKNSGCTVDLSDDVTKALPQLDVLYTSRLRKEYLPEGSTLTFRPVDNEVMSFMKKEGVLMEPLPRVGQILEEVDADPRAKYFEQVKNSIPVRKALILNLLGIDTDSFLK